MSAAAEAERLAAIAAGTTPALYRSTRLADVVPERVEWLWSGRLPRRKLVVLDGDPTVGKSTLMLDLVARITTGRPMPGETFATVLPSDVVLLAAEDGLADTIRPRLDAAGADCARVHHLDAVPVIGDEGTVQSGHLPVWRTVGYEACWYCCSHSVGETWLRVL
ncbi:MAG: AAA family ATPase [Acidimicrobiales bacterium]